MEVTTIFDNIAHFRKVLNDVMIRGGFDIKRIYNDKKRFKEKYATEHFLWRVTSGQLVDN